MRVLVRIERGVAMLMAVLCLCGAAAAKTLYADFPDEINADEKYMFYSHGYIVEGNDPKPVHPEFGIYDFPAVSQALANSEYNVIAYQRPKDTDPREYAISLAVQVRQLAAAGVKLENIVLVGFSRGGRITAYASHELSETPVKAVILAGCGGWFEAEDEVKLNGEVLSVFEVSDSVGSCKELAERSDALVSFDEVAINTGKSHGAFYTPDPVWVGPVMDWIGAKRSDDAD